MRACTALLLIVACTPARDGRASDPASVASEAARRGPTRLPIDGDANGLWWEAGLGTLFIADDDGDRILAWSDAAGFETVAVLPRAPEGRRPGLGQLVRMHDGTFVVTRFGHGTAGDVAIVPREGPPAIVPNLDPARRRIGLTLADDGTLYDAWFVALGKERVGAIGRLSLAGSEVTVIDGLAKPVGVLAVGGALIVTDQERGQVLRAPLEDPSRTSAIVQGIEAPDLLCGGPDGAVFVGDRGGSVWRIADDGTVAIVASGLWQVRGVAFDPEHRRLFVADHDPDDVEHTIHVLPIDL